MTIYVLVTLLVACIIGMAIVAVKEDKRAEEEFKKQIRDEIDRIARD